MAGDRTARRFDGVLGAPRYSGPLAAVSWLLAGILAASSPGTATAQGFPLRIDCPDAPLYAAGGLTLTRDLDAQGLVLMSRVQHNRVRQAYDITCSTEAAPVQGEAVGDAAAPGRAPYLFVCTARFAGHSSGGVQASRLGSVPAGFGLDHPETQASIAEAICPAARLALARFRGSSAAVTD